MKSKTIGRTQGVSIRHKRGRLPVRADSKLENILVPIDFSEASLGALDRAVALAKSLAAKITLLHVVQSVSAPAAYGYVPDYPADDYTSDPRLMACRLQELAQAKVPPRLRGEAIASAGATGQTIALIAKQRGTDLIVMSTHGHSGLARALLGSTAEYIVRNGPCPVLTVRRPVLAKAPHGEARAMRIKNILVPVDLSEPSRKSWAYAAGLAERLKARLTLLHVVPPMSVPRSQPVQDARRNLRAAEGAQVRLDEMAALMAKKQLRISTRVAHGEAAEEIVRIATDTAFDLVVVASHGRGGMKRAMLGSTAENVIRHASCPVLVVRRPVGAGQKWRMPPLFFPVAPVLP